MFEVVFQEMLPIEELEEVNPELLAYEPAFYEDDDFDFDFDEVEDNED